MKLNVASMMKFLRSKTALGLLTASAMYMMAANYNSAESAHMLAAHEPYRRELRTLDLGDGQCEVDLLEDGIPTPPNAVRTLLTSYPGSGKRFTWMVIKALTNQEIAGDWDFTGNLDKNPLTVKTSWPHHEGNWNWGTQMDQVLLLVRSPRWAIPSYHNLRFELGYSNSFADSIARVLNTYTTRPAVAEWEAWRDANAIEEINAWADFIDFWMSGGIVPGTTAPHENCLTKEIDCGPKAVMDFDKFYQVHPTSDFYALDNLLETAANVQLISSAIHVCVLDKVHNDPELPHNHHRTSDTGVETPMYKFTIPQMELMVGKVTQLKNKYSSPPYAGKYVPGKLVKILDGYLDDIVPELNSLRKE